MGTGTCREAARARRRWLATRFHLVLFFSLGAAACRFSPPQAKCIVFQLLRVMEYLHTHPLRFVHRDLKCANLLLTDDNVLKLGDFGLARSLEQHSFSGGGGASSGGTPAAAAASVSLSSSMTAPWLLGAASASASAAASSAPRPAYSNTVITLWYRPPELLLGATDYDGSSMQARRSAKRRSVAPGAALSSSSCSPSPARAPFRPFAPLVVAGAVDMWSVGCIAAELLLGRALLPARTEAEQLKQLFSKIGSPPPGEGNAAARVSRHRGIEGAREPGREWWGGREHVVPPHPIAADLAPPLCPRRCYPCRLHAAGAAAVGEAGPGDVHRWQAEPVIGVASVVRGPARPHPAAPADAAPGARSDAPHLGAGGAGAPLVHRRAAHRQRRTEPR